MKKIFLILTMVVCWCFKSNAQQTTIYPTNWWVGMKMNQVQLLIKSEEKSLSSRKIDINYPGVKLVKIHRFKNQKYVAIDLLISAAAKPGEVSINFKGVKKTVTVKWPLLNKQAGNGIRYAQGVTSEDFINLLLVDRFSNGDTTNDRIAGMRDQSLNRDSMYLRHGGDFQGILNHIDYFKSLGVNKFMANPGNGK